MDAGISFQEFLDVELDERASIDVEEVPAP
jgi:hypothetical protein